MSNIQQYLDAAEENNRMNNATFSSWIDFAVIQRGVSDHGAQHLYDTYNSTLPELSEGEIEMLRSELGKLQDAEIISAKRLEESGYFNDRSYSKAHFEAMAQRCIEKGWTMLQIEGHFKGQELGISGFASEMADAADEVEEKE